MIDERHQVWIRKKFPIFYTMKINLEKDFTSNELQCLEQELKINRNNLSKQCQKTFKKLKKLSNETEKLFKSNKELYTILSLTKAQQIHEIILPHKMIASLEPLENMNMLKLNDIDLSFNKIQSIDPLFTSSLPSLVYLNLCTYPNNFPEKNQVSSIKGIQQTALNKLKSLNLSRNYILNVEAISVGQFPSLEKLDLSQNDITNILSLYKITSRELNYINLQNNRLKEVRNMERLCVRKLSELNIKDNELVGSERLEKFQPTTIVRYKKLFVDEETGNQEQELEFIRHEYKISYSKALCEASKSSFLKFYSVLNNKKNQSHVFGESKHERHSTVTQFKKKQQKATIVTTKKLLILD